MPAPSLASAAIAETSISSWLERSEIRRVGPLFARRLADQRDHLRALDRPQAVDDPLGVRLLGTDLGEVFAQQVGDDEPAALERVRPLERARQKLQLRELHRLVDVLEDPVDVGARFDELGRQAERLRRRVRVLEAAGVGDETDVKRLRDLAASGRRRARGGCPDHLGGRRRVGDEQVDVAEAGVVVMVVDVDHELRAIDGLRALGRSAARSRSRRRAGRAPRCRWAARAAPPSGRETGTRPASAPLPERYMTTSFPSARRPSVAPSSEPSASPSGFSCADDDEPLLRAEDVGNCLKVTRLRLGHCRPILAPREVRRKLVDQLRHPNAALDRSIVCERQVGVLREAPAPG